MTNCKTCKHWQHPNITTTFGRCDKLLDILRVVVEDTFSGYYIETADDFGCSLYKPKELV